MATPGLTKACPGGPMVLLTCQPLASAWPLSTSAVVVVALALSCFSMTMVALLLVVFLVVDLVFSAVFLLAGALAAQALALQAVALRVHQGGSLAPMGPGLGALRAKVSGPYRGW